MIVLFQTQSFLFGFVNKCDGVWIDVTLMAATFETVPTIWMGLEDLFLNQICNAKVGTPLFFGWTAKQTYTTQM